MYLCSRKTGKSLLVMKYLGKIIKVVTLTAAMSVFMACDGTSQDYNHTFDVAFHVVSDAGEPLSYVEVYSKPDDDDSCSNYDWRMLGKTDTAGIVSGYVKDYGLPNVYRFADKDSSYFVKDTVINEFNEDDTVEIVLNVLVH